jgi:hypothetical protein
MKNKQQILSEPSDATFFSQMRFELKNNKQSSVSLTPDISNSLVGNPFGKRRLTTDSQASLQQSTVESSSSTTCFLENNNNNNQQNISLFSNNNLFFNTSASFNSFSNKKQNEKNNEKNMENLIQQNSPSTSTIVNKVAIRESNVNYEQSSSTNSNNNNNNPTPSSSENSVENHDIFFPLSRIYFFFLQLSVIFFKYLGRTFQFQNWFKRIKRKKIQKVIKTTIHSLSKCSKQLKIL